MLTNFSPVRGMRDFNVEEMQKRSYILQVIKDVVDVNGFKSIKTPAVESKNFLNKGNEKSENSKLGFNVSTTGLETNTIMGLRYDLTVPLARFYSSNKSKIALPFRSYQTGDVYRAERPQKGRYREFTQCDIDVIGDATVVAEIDVLNTAFQVFESSNIKGVTASINSKEILLNILTGLGVEEQCLVDVIREIDKMDKISEQEVLENISVFCPKTVVVQLQGLMKSVFAGTNNEEKLEAVSFFAKNSNISEILDFFGEEVVFNPFLARGMDYYTGTIFEFKSVEEKLSIAAGGRYDDFKDTVPAVGLSFGFERIIPLIETIDYGKMSCLMIYSKTVPTKKIFEIKNKLIDGGFSVTIQPKPKNISYLLNKSIGTYNFFVMVEQNISTYEVKPLV